MSSRTETPTQKAATAYLSRGWCAIPVPAKTKNPGRKHWESERYEPGDVPHVFGGDLNIGIHCGEPSNGLVDVDLDTREARSLASVFLPPTSRVHGRRSSPSSHWWYQCDPAPERVTRYKDADRVTLVEIRSTGGQTIVPPSVHPDGERLTWNITGEAAIVDGRILQQQVERLAACTMLARAWTEGSRHDLALCVAGVLLRHGWDQADAWEFIAAAAEAAGDRDQLREHEQAVFDTLDAISSDDPATGIPTLIDICGDGFTRRFLRWLDIDGGVGVRVRVQPGRVSKNGKHETDSPIEEEEPEPEEPEWAIPSDAPAVEINDLPYWLNRLVRHIEPYTPMFPPDWPIMMGLSFWSILWPQTHIQNLNLSVWALGLGGQSVGKNIGTDELRRVIRAVSNRDVSFYSAGSPEGMWDLLDGVGKQMFAYHAEYAGYLQLLTRDHMRGAKEALCDLYDGRPVNYHRAQKKGVNIDDPIVAVCATTTPGAFRDHATIEDMRDGYLSRFMFCAPDRKRVSPRYFPRSDDSNREQLVRELTAHINHCRGVTHAHFESTGSARDPDLIEQFRIFHDMDTGETETLEEAMEDRSIPPGRLLARIKKIAALFALAEEPPTIQPSGRIVTVSDEHIAAATTIVERGRFYAARARSWLDENEDIALSDRVLRLLLKSPKGLTRREICQYAPARVADVRGALDLLVDSGQVVSERSQGSRAVRWHAVKLRGTQ